MTGAAPLAYLSLPHGNSAAAALLSRLGEAHEELLREMENMDRVTLGPIFDARELTAARWRIGQASLRRRTLSASVLSFLTDRVDDRDAGALKLLQSENQREMSRSTAHVYGWTVRAISQEWNRYCQASRDIRIQMKANILLEKQLLYPLLERLAHRKR